MKTIHIYRRFAVAAAVAGALAAGDAGDAGAADARAAKLRVFSPKRKALGTLKLPRPPQNLAFAGTDKRDLYVVGRGAVWKIRTEAQGPANRAK